MKVSNKEWVAIREALWAVLDSQQCEARSDAELLSLDHRYFDDPKEEIEMHQNLIKRIDKKLKER